MSHHLVCIIILTPLVSHLYSVAIAISDSPEIRQLLVDLQSGVDPDELEEAMSKKDDDEAATCNRKTRRLGHNSQP